MKHDKKIRRRTEKANEKHHEHLDPLHYQEAIEQFVSCLQLLRYIKAYD